MAPLFKTLVSALCLSGVAVAHGGVYARSPNAQAHDRRMQNVGRRSLGARSVTEDCTTSIASATGTYTNVVPTASQVTDEDDCATTSSSSTYGSTPSSTPTPEQPNRLMVSEIYKVWPQHPDRAAGPVDYINVEAWQNQSSVEQVAVFRGIPDGATNCVLGWTMTDKIDRVFLEMGTPLLRVSPLAGFSTPPNSHDVSFNAVKDFNTTGLLSQPNFAWWTTSTDPGRDHSGGTAFECNTDMYIHYKLDDTTMVDSEIEPAVFMLVDEHNGWFIRYETA